jgi:membrane-bound lytic murein transglycosylase B
MNLCRHRFQAVREAFHRVSYAHSAVAHYVVSGVCAFLLSFTGKAAWSKLVNSTEHKKAEEFDFRAWRRRVGPTRRQGHALRQKLKESLRTTNTTQLIALNHRGQTQTTSESTTTQPLSANSKYLEHHG